MDDIKQNGKDIAELSIQRRAEANPTAGVYSWWFSRADDGLAISPWWSEQRDLELREFWRREGNDILQGAVSSMVKKFKAMSWVVEGPNRVANKFQALLSEAEFGAGWGTLLGKTLEDYHTQDKGAFWELIGAGKIDGPISGPVLGVAHLDAQFCQLTGDPVYPVIFNNSKDGKPHKLHASRVCHLVDMPSPNEIMNGIGFCAVSRVIASSQVLLKLAQYKNEKLSDLPEAGLLLLNNVLPHQFEDAQANHQRGRRKLGQELWSNIMTLFSLDPSQPASAELISFASLPEAFNELESTNIYVNIVALAFGVDVREFWPMTSGALGSARESEVMAQKAKGKGIGDVISTLERAVNWRILPESVNFRFDFQDDEEDKLKADINKIKTETIMMMFQSKGNDPAMAEPPVTRMEIRQMLANSVPEYFKEEFLEFDVTDETEVTDTEREDKSDRVSIDNKGRVKSFRRLKQRTDDVLAMAEKNYRDGRIGLDDLLEFRLGMKLDDRGNI